MKPIPHFASESDRKAGVVLPGRHFLYRARANLTSMAKPTLLVALSCRLISPVKLNIVSSCHDPIFFLLACFLYGKVRAAVVTLCSIIAAAGNVYLTTYLLLVVPCIWSFNHALPNTTASRPSTCCCVPKQRADTECAHCLMFYATSPLQCSAQPH